MHADPVNVLSSSRATIAHVLRINRPRSLGSEKNCLCLPRFPFIGADPLKHVFSSAHRVF